VLLTWLRWTLGWTNKGLRRLRHMASSARALLVRLLAPPALLAAQPRLRRSLSAQICARTAPCVLPARPCALPTLRRRGAAEPCCSLIIEQAGPPPLLSLLKVVEDVDGRGCTWAKVKDQMDTFVMNPGFMRTLGLPTPDQVWELLDNDPWLQRRRVQLPRLALLQEGRGSSSLCCVDELRLRLPRRREWRRPA
jgi:hypothetical protein